MNLSRKMAIAIASNVNATFRTRTDDGIGVSGPGSIGVDGSGVSVTRRH